MFEGTEIGVVQHVVGIQDTHHRHFGEIQTLTDHLCSHQDLRLTLREVFDNPFIGIPAARGIHIHPRHFHIWEKLHQLIFYLLCADPSSTNSLTLTVRTYLRHLIHTTTIMASQLIIPFMVGQRYITM